MATAFLAESYGTEGQPITNQGPGDITVPLKFYTGGTTRAGQPGDATHTQLLTPGLFVVNDTVSFIRLPKGAVITEIYLDIPKIDSATSSTLSLGLKGGGTTAAGATVAAAPAAFLSVSTAGRAIGAGLTSSLNGFVPVSLPYPELLADDVLIMLAAAAGAGAGTATAGTAFNGWIRYYMRSTVF